MSGYAEKRVTLRDGAQVRLRSPVEDDAEALLAYLDDVRRETPFIMFDPEDELPSVEAERQWVRRSGENPASLMILAEAGGGIVALCDATAGVGLRRARHRGEIGISVIAAWCNRGLGTILMSELIGWARAHPAITVLRLGAFAHNNRAIAVYRKVGFACEGVRRGAVRYADGQYADEVMMSMWVGLEPPPVPAAGVIPAHHFS